MLNGVQLITVLHSLAFEWPQPLKTILNMLYAITFNLDLLRFLFSLADVQSPLIGFTVRLSLMPMCVAVIIGAFFFKKLCVKQQLMVKVELNLAL